MRHGFHDQVFEASAGKNFADHIEYPSLPKCSRMCSSFLNSAFSSTDLKRSKAFYLSIFCGFCDFGRKVLQRLAERCPITVIADSFYLRCSGHRWLLLPKNSAST